jgi:hypothetical protein
LCALSIGTSHILGRSYNRWVFSFGVTVYFPNTAKTAV